MTTDPNQWIKAHLRAKDEAAVLADRLRASGWTTCVDDPHDRKQYVTRAYDVPPLLKLLPPYPPVVQPLFEQGTTYLRRQFATGYDPTYLLQPPRVWFETWQHALQDTKRPCARHDTRDGVEREPL